MSTLDALLDLTEKFSGSEAITLHPERCLNTRFRALDCSICADVCPATGAITVSGGKPALDNDVCQWCGLCLHRCPTEAFTRSDNLSANLVKTAAALPAGSVDLICPQHPHPEHGPASQAVQTQRCLTALSSATLLELSTLPKEIWLDDTPCAECPLGQVHPTLTQTVNEANHWASLLDDPTLIRQRTSDLAENRPMRQRPVFDAAAPPISRRGLLGAFKQSGQAVAAADEKIELVKGGRAVPASARLPHSLPHHRAKILALLEKSSAAPTVLPDDTLPILNLELDPTRCTACGLCAKFCPTAALKFLSDGASFALTFQPTLCLGPACGICIPACPEQAVSSQPITEDLNLFKRQPLLVGELITCQTCKQPIAVGPDLPQTCFACRPRSEW